MITILIFLAVLALLILIHEFGHFIAARSFGIGVLEFGLGFPPRLASFRIGPTLYSLNLIPIGGFVKLLGEEDPTEPTSLARKGAGTRLIVLCAGAFMNFILAAIIFTVLFMLPQEQLQGLVKIQGVADGSPADLAGLQQGDIVLKLDGRSVRNTQELTYAIRMNLGDSTKWEISRPKRLVTGFITGGSEPGSFAQPTSEGTYITTYLTPRWKPPEGQGNAGVLISTIEGQVTSISYPIWEAIPKGMVKMKEMLILFRNEIIGWIFGANRSSLAGPIGIAHITGEVAKAGILPLMELAALLSLNLAILNVLPIPALDGGRILFVLIEWVRRGKRIPHEREAIVHLLGFIFLISLTVLVSYFDIVRIIQGESLIR